MDYFDLVLLFVLIIAVVINLCSNNRGSRYRSELLEGLGRDTSTWGPALEPSRKSGDDQSGAIDQLNANKINNKKRLSDEDLFNKANKITDPIQINKDVGKGGHTLIGGSGGVHHDDQSGALDQLKSNDPSYNVRESDSRFYNDVNKPATHVNKPATHVNKPTTHADPTTHSNDSVKPNTPTDISKMYDMIYNKHPNSFKTPEPSYDISTLDFRAVDVNDDVQPLPLTGSYQEQVFNMMDGVSNTDNENLSSDSVTVSMVWADWCGYSNKAMDAWPKMMDHIGKSHMGVGIKYKDILEKNHKEKIGKGKEFEVDGYPTGFIRGSINNQKINHSFNAIDVQDMINKIKGHIQKYIKEKSSGSAVDKSSTRGLVGGHMVGGLLDDNSYDFPSGGMDDMFANNLKSSGIEAA